MKSKKKIYYALISAAFWLILWQALAMAVSSDLLVPVPVSVIKRLFALCAERDFRISAVVSLSRVSLGFITGAVLGTLFAVGTAKSPLLSAIIKPALSMIKATPVASFIILALVWLKSGQVPVLTAALVTTPVFWSNTEKGILQTDAKLLEMARAYRLKKSAVFAKIYVPSVKPYFFAAVNSAMGMAWKAGIAAEVLCPFGNSIGTALYNSKIYLEITDLFAWTFAVVILSIVLEKLIMFFVRKERVSLAETE